MKNIALIGMMGSGKTTVGKALAHKLGYRFIDTDVEIENSNKMKISDIFSKFGEKAFRHIEEETIEFLLKRSSDRVIATGGGSVLSNKTFNNFKRNSILVYLQTSPEVILCRVKGCTSRPLLQTSNPVATIKELLGERSEFYQRAGIKVCTDNKDVSDIVDEILEKLDSYDV